LINVVADRALLGAYALGVFEVTQPIVSRAAIEVIPERRNHSLLLVATASALVMTTLVMIGYWVADQPNIAAEPSAGRGPSVVVTAEEVEVAAVPAGADIPDSVVGIDDSSSQGASQAKAGVTLQTGLVSRPPKSDEALQRAAYQQVFNAWSIVYDTSSKDMPCEFANLNELQCASQTGTLTDIERLDLPVVIELWDEQAEPYHAALLGLDGTSLALGLAGTTFTVTPKDLREQWFGNFTYVWPQPPLYHGLLNEGDLHDSVVVLRDRLQTALGRPITSTIRNLFDAELANALLEFQKREALVPDRVVGPQTWVRLSRVTGSTSMPSLHNFRPDREP